MTILSKIFPQIRKHFEIVICGLVFLLLLLRNPFSLRTQIPNFAPAPDAFYYVVPARSLVEGKGPYMTREGRSFSPIVPPLYSFVLAPFFLLKDDPRMFYFANVVLAFVAFFIFTQTAKVLFPGRRLLRFILLFLFVTNRILYWFPELAMAENLLLPLYLSGLWLLFTKASLRKAALMGIVAAALYATKYASLPLSVTFVLLYLLKLQGAFGFSLRWRQMGLVLIFSAALVFLGFGLYARFVLFQNDYFDPVARVTGILVPKSSGPVQANPAQQPEKVVPWISLVNVTGNFPLYAGALIGRGMTVLWEWTPLLLPWVAAMGWIGLAAGFLGKRHFEAFSLFLLIITQLFLMLLFYTPDGRYIIHVIPTLILGSGFFFSWIIARNKKVGNLLLFLFLAYVVLVSAVRLKKDIMLNLRYSESPWWYIAVLELNKTMDTQKPAKEPYVITPLYPYLVDFFSTGKYRLLPMSDQQEFRAYKEATWGDFDYSHLETVYLNLIAQGHPVYLASYGIGHDDVLIKAFDYLQKAFKLEEISSGCYNLCKVYRVWPTGKPLNLKGPK